MEINYETIEDINDCILEKIRKRVRAGCYKLCDEYVLDDEAKKDLEIFISREQNSFVQDFLHTYEW